MVPSKSLLGHIISSEAVECVRHTWTITACKFVCRVKSLSTVGPFIVDQTNCECLLVKCEQSTAASSSSSASLSLSVRFLCLATLLHISSMYGLLPLAALTSILFHSKRERRYNWDGEISMLFLVGFSSSSLDYLIIIFTLIQCNTMTVV